MPTNTITIEVYPDGPDGDRDVFAVLTDHTPDLPDGFDDELQAWANEHFDTADVDGGNENAGEFEYEPNGDIVEIRKR